MCLVLLHVSTNNLYTAKKFNKVSIFCMEEAHEDLRELVLPSSFLYAKHSCLERPTTRTLPETTKAIILLKSHIFSSETPMKGSASLFNESSGENIHTTDNQQPGVLLQITEAIILLNIQVSMFEVHERQRDLVGREVREVVTEFNLITSLTWESVGVVFFWGVVSSSMLSFLLSLSI